ncbi:hypothetical protein CCZ01_07590 [Helicobacter monodelphidis]|uniref:YhcH/YjgK/YiaL family protein n=1 Tax=Helicobacter sp. 15-1451 TaxID=2004995 RepID=UPI000DCE2200|nr:YhcH/YjgK/YiaL family protein [Helicobacter sp. 15-1451]RAX57021.1 hypothetical protein CCZ01_07590 [Helicobacter sp. 15-1451]
MLLSYHILNDYQLFAEKKTTLYIYDLLTNALDGKLFNKIEKLKVGDRKVEEKDYGILVITESYLTKPTENAFYESHRHYTDFQLLISGYEKFFVGHINDFTIQQEYDSQKDLIIYQTPIDLETKASCILLKPEALAIFFPTDVHAGALQVHSTSDIVKKMVLKVPQDILQPKI